MCKDSQIPLIRKLLISDSKNIFGKKLKRL